MGWIDAARHKTRTIGFALGAVALIVAAIPTNAPAQQPDEREMVNLPEHMQTHMLGNMRAHLRALEAILAALGKDDVDRAAAIAEQELGFSSLDDHGAAHLAQFMPEGMREAGTQMHRAASRFATAANDAQVQGTYDAQRNVFAALQDITAACNACHAGYRIR